MKYLGEKKCNNIYSGAELYVFLEIRSESLKRRKRCPWGICHSLCKIHLKLKTVEFECFIFSSIQYTYESSVDFSGVDQLIFSKHSKLLQRDGWLRSLFSGDGHRTHALGCSENFILNNRNYIIHN